MASSLHCKVRDWLSKSNLGLLVYEEYSIPGGLRFDFLLPSIRLAIEVDGKQHEKYNSHFYSSTRDFLEAIERDIAKERYCEENHILLWRIPEADLNFDSFLNTLSAMVLQAADRIQNNPLGLKSLVKEKPLPNPRSEQHRKYYDSQKEKLREKRREMYLKSIKKK